MLCEINLYCWFESAWWFRVVCDRLLCLMNDCHMFASIPAEHWFYSTIVGVFKMWTAVHFEAGHFLLTRIYDKWWYTFTLPMCFSVPCYVSAHMCSETFSRTGDDYFDCALWVLLGFAHILNASFTYILKVTVCSPARRFKLPKSFVINEWNDSWTLNVEWIYYNCRICWMSMNNLNYIVFGLVLFELH